MNARRAFYAAVITLGLLVAVLTVSTPIEAGIERYALKPVKWPLPCMPEPVLVGGLLNATVKATVNASSWHAVLSSELATLELTLHSATYDNASGLWQLAWIVPNASEAREGVYDLTITFVKESGETVRVKQPHSVWVLREWPNVLNIALTSDLHLPGGEEYAREVLTEFNLIDPTLVVLAGDIVDTGTIARGWMILNELIELAEDPVYVGPGNHDYAGDNGENYRKVVGYFNYSIVIGDFLLLVLDTGPEGYVSMDQLRWAEGVLSENVERVKIIVMHHPFFSRGMKSRGWLLKGITVDGFENLKAQGLIYYSWANHPTEAREFLRLVLEYDVRLILSGHIHTDLNVVVEDANGSRHYFVTSATVAPAKYEGEIRGFKLLKVFANGTVDERSLYYDGTGIGVYPNSIPIDLGEKVEPYKLGLIEYYYVNNDGEHHAVAFRARNELLEDFKDIRVIFKLPSDKPLDEYTWYPERPKYETVVVGNVTYVILRSVDLPANSTVKYVVAAVNDTDKPSVEIVDVKIGAEWIKVRVRACDEGWGVDEVRVTYSLDGELPRRPELLDLVGYGEGYVEYLAWIPRTGEETCMEILATVSDFAGNAASTSEVVEFRKPTPSLTPTPTPTSPTATTPTTPTTPATPTTPTTPATTPTSATPTTQAVEWHLVAIAALALAAILVVAVVAKRR